MERTAKFAHLLRTFSHAYESAGDGRPLGDVDMYRAQYRRQLRTNVDLMLRGEGVHMQQGVKPEWLQKFDALFDSEHYTLNYYHWKQRPTLTDA